MDPYDTQAVRAVWERVRLCNEQLLLSMMAGEQQDRDFYRRVAKQVGPLGKQLLTLAEEEDGHLQQLRSLYERLYGKAPLPEHSLPKRYPNLRQALLAQVEEELSGAQNYSKAAKHFSSNTELFLQLSQDEANHAKILQNLLSRNKPQGRKPSCRP